LYSRAGGCRLAEASIASFARASTRRAFGWMDVEESGRPHAVVELADDLEVLRWRERATLRGFVLARCEARGKSSGLEDVLHNEDVCCTLSLRLERSSCAEEAIPRGTEPVEAIVPPAPRGEILALLAERAARGRRRTDQRRPLDD